ncbi:hypothetical protein HCUR_00397 [Holospora curviuscula]|uniref:Uncharacterized protein n=2 Tax=Holospora curviuscula TaxID=1082868 RepID=A0A2S5RA49_9PROT|nr:hypothetical protein HCUR_00397 [Holospora curviuscula]
MELCIVLSVLGILIGAGSSLFKGYFRRKQDLRTQSHQAQILNAVVWFVLREKRLPCPASYESNGVSLLHCNQHWNGLVPFRSLGLSERIAKDGFGRWISFVVEPDLTEYRVTHSTALGLCKFILGTKSTLNVIEQNVSVTHYVKGDGVILVLISHGEKKSNSNSALEDRSLGMNSQDTKNYYLPWGHNKEGYNDRVVFFTKTQLLHEMGLKCTDYFLSSGLLSQPIPCVK